MKKLDDIDYSKVPGVMESAKQLLKSLIRKFYVKPKKSIQGIYGKKIKTDEAPEGYDWSSYDRDVKEFFNKEYERVLSQIRVARFFKRKILFIYGVPTHGNIGDRAISLAENKFLKKNFWTHKVINVPAGIFFTSKKILPQDVVNNYDVILLHGGGNMGNVYTQEEDLRRAVIEKFPSNKIVIFPQTINFSKKFNNYNKELSETKRVYSNHKQLTIIAREEVSYGIMKDIFPNNNVLLAPDIVLFYNPKKLGQGSEYSVVTLMRDDVEKTLSGNDQNKLFKHLNDRFGKDKVLHTDMQYKAEPSPWQLLGIEKASDEMLVSGKLKQISNSKIVVTDRLHGMIFSVLMNRVCVVFSNHDWKIKGVFDRWIKPLDLPVYYCEDIEQAKQVIDSLDYESINAIYSPKAFKKEWTKIKKAIA